MGPSGLGYWSTISEGSLAVKDESRFLVRSVAAAFDAYLDGSKRLHSRAV
jgi:hypothetical protein